VVRRVQRHGAGAARPGWNCGTRGYCICDSAACSAVSAPPPPPPPPPHPPPPPPRTIVAATEYVRAGRKASRVRAAGSRYVTLGTDGFGRSDTRAGPAQFFEVDGERSARRLASRCGRRLAAPRGGAAASSNAEAKSRCLRSGSRNAGDLREWVTTNREFHRRPLHTKQRAIQHADP